MLRGKNFTAICCLFLFLAGCGENEAVVAARKAEAEAQKKAAEAAAAIKKDEDDAKNALRARLKDPDSAKFGKFTIAGKLNGGQTACLTYNARNSFGGYAGDQEAIMAKFKDGENAVWVAAMMGDEIPGRALSHEKCIETLLKTETKE